MNAPGEWLQAVACLIDVVVYRQFGAQFSPLRMGYARAL
jgi:hypothetical protein